MTHPSIIIEGVGSHQQRYDTLGDWHWDVHGNLRIAVCDGGGNETDPFENDEAFLIALHELVEAKLCHRAGITQGAVDAFDMRFVADGRRTGEPGDDPEAPYRVQHRQAMLIEHMMAVFLGKTDYGRVE